MRTTIHPPDRIELIPETPPEEESIRRWLGQSTGVSLSTRPLITSKLGHSRPMQLVKVETLILEFTSQER